MSAALLDPPRSLPGRPAGAARPGGPHVTLEERLQAVWRAARRDDPAACPVCSGPMRRHDGAAHCDDCGSRLS